jgi:hypothetical protein
MQKADEGIFTRRLARLLRLGQYDADLNSCGQRLIKRAIAATYQDCVALGSGAKARELLAEHGRLREFYPTTRE